MNKKVVYEQHAKEFAGKLAQMIGDLAE